jgi:hypothetical protein
MTDSRARRRVATALVTLVALSVTSGCGVQLPALPGVARPDSSTAAVTQGSVQPRVDPTPAPDPRLDLLSRLNMHYPDDIKSDVQALLQSSSIDLDERYPEQNIPATADQPGSSHTRMVVDLHGYEVEFDTVLFASATEQIVALRGSYLADNGHAGGNWELVPEARQVTVDSLPGRAAAVLGDKADWLDFHGTAVAPDAGQRAGQSRGVCLDGGTRRAWGSNDGGRHGNRANCRSYNDVNGVVSFLRRSVASSRHRNNRPSWSKRPRTAGTETARRRLPIQVSTIAAKKPRAAPTARVTVRLTFAQRSHADWTFPGHAPRLP